MKQIRPYIFWIVCGVILIVELGLVFTMEPSSELEAGVTVRDAKEAADRAYRNKLKDDLERRAKATNAAQGGPVPPGTGIHPEDTDAIEQELMAKYIISPDWQTRFASIVANYSTQLEDLRDELARLSNVLREPVSTSPDGPGWYDAYESQSASLLREIIDAEAMQLPSSYKKSDLTRQKLVEDTMLRRQLGIQTHSQFTQFEGADSRKRQLLTAQLRIIERIARAVIGSRGQVAASPISALSDDLPDPQEPTAARIIGINWIGTGPEKKIVAKGAVHQLRLELDGSPAAIHAALSAIGNIESPIVVRLGSSWKRRNAGGFNSGPRFIGVPVESVVCDATLAVLEFTERDAGDADADGAGGEE